MRGSGQLKNLFLCFGVEDLFYQARSAKGAMMRCRKSSHFSGRPTLIDSYAAGITGNKPRFKEFALPSTACYFCCTYREIDTPQLSDRSYPMSVTSKIRRQGGAAVITLPPTLLKLLHLDVGAQLELNVVNGELIARPVLKPDRKRYSLEELLEGSEQMAELNEQTASAREGDAVGRELG
jgi:antitoxin ChpS